jgi:hypothetical protein
LTSHGPRPRNRDGLDQGCSGAGDHPRLCALIESLPSEAVWRQGKRGPPDVEVLHARRAGRAAIWPWSRGFERFERSLAQAQAALTNWPGVGMRRASGSLEARPIHRRPAKCALIARGALTIERSWRPRGPNLERAGPVRRSEPAVGRVRRTGRALEAPAADRELHGRRTGARWPPTARPRLRRAGPR